MTEELTSALFKKYVGQSFSVCSGGQQDKIALTLASVKDIEPKRQTIPMETFALSLEGDAKQQLPQGIYTFDHTELGSFTLMMVPVVSPVPGRQRYEIVINRLIQS